MGTLANTRERSPKFGPKGQMHLGWPKLLSRALSVERGRAVDGFWPTPRGPGECRGARGGEMDLKQKNPGGDAVLFCHKPGQRRLQKSTGDVQLYDPNS
jgi:hypothetical protein